MIAKKEHEYLSSENIWLARVRLWYSKQFIWLLLFLHNKHLIALNIYIDAQIASAV